MKIFVISLVGSTERREQISALLKKQGLSFEFFDAIKGSLEHPLIKEKYNEKKRVSRKGYSLKLGELGAFASHYLLWEKCSNLNEPIVILEDDLILEENLAATFAELEKHIENLGIIRLCKSYNIPFIKLRNASSDIKLVKYTKRVLGAQGYVISPDAAKKYLAHADEWFEPVDDYMIKEWLHHVNHFGIEPGCLEADPTFESDIGNRKKTKVPFYQRVKRECYRSYEWTRHMLYLLPLIIKIKLGAQISKRSS